MLDFQQVEQRSQQKVSRWFASSITKPAKVSRWFASSITKPAKVSRWFASSITKPAKVSRWFASSITKPAKVSRWFASSITKPAKRTKPKHSEPRRGCKVSLWKGLYGCIERAGQMWVDSQQRPDSHLKHTCSKPCQSCEPFQATSLLIWWWCRHKVQHPLLADNWPRINRPKGRFAHRWCWSITLWTLVARFGWISNAVSTFLGQANHWLVL